MGVHAILSSYVCLWVGGPIGGRGAVSLVSLGPFLEDSSAKSSDTDWQGAVPQALSDTSRVTWLCH